MSSYSVASALHKLLPDARFLDTTISQISYDVTIQFHSAKDLPKTDIIGHADPYFLANIDEHISLKSTIKINTHSPIWDDEKWIVLNIPDTSVLTVKVYDKDDEKISDDFIGEFEITDLINYVPPPEGHIIVGPFGFRNGRFHLSIQANQRPKDAEAIPRYTFDGPCRYSRHNSLAVGRLTALNAECIYSTFKIHMRRISNFFHPHERQHWNKKYKAAQKIFSNDAISLATQAAIKIGHKVLYGQTIKNHENGQLENANDLWKFVFADPITKQIKPCIYTYVIDDNTWRFSETGVQFFTDFASKHALLANCSEHVRYAGEFHPRPRYGWDKCDDEWELVFDNGSGTYSPIPDLIINVKKLLEFNFPGLNVVTYNYEDPELKGSVAELKRAAENHKNSVATIQKLVSSSSRPV